MELQLMMTPDDSDSSRPTPLTLHSAKGKRQEPEIRRDAPCGGSSISTPEEAIQGLRTLSREARALQEGLGRLGGGKELGQPSARRHLRIGQSALEHAAAVFELLASLLESD